jgi:predicted GIY-YIG superfamily endonuclease
MITINGIRFDSLYDAATYISGCSNNVEGRSESHIRRELKGYLSGKRKSNVLYDKYVLGKG